MSSALKSAVESGAHTLSDLVDEARSRIEDLPPLAKARKKRSRKKSSVFALILFALFAVVIAKQVRPHSTDQRTDQQADKAK